MRLESSEISESSLGSNMFKPFQICSNTLKSAFENILRLLELEWVGRQGDLQGRRGSCGGRGGLGLCVKGTDAGGRH